MTLISKGRAINTIAISVQVIVSEIAIASKSPLASYLFIGHMEAERSCSRDGCDEESPRMQIKMFVIKPTDHNGFFFLPEMYFCVRNQKIILLFMH